MLVNKTNTYAAEHSRKQGYDQLLRECRQVPDVPEKLLTDRSAYIEYLESQLSKVTSSLYNESNVEKQLDQQGEQLVCVEEKVLNLAKMLKVHQDFSEEREQRAQDQIAALLQRVQVLESRPSVQPAQFEAQCQHLEADLMKRIEAQAAEVRLTRAATESASYQLRQDLQSQMSAWQADAMAELEEAAKHAASKPDPAVVHGNLRDIQNAHEDLKRVVSRLTSEAASKAELQQSLECADMLERLRGTFETELRELSRERTSFAGHMTSLEAAMSAQNALRTELQTLAAAAGVRGGAADRAEAALQKADTNIRSLVEQGMQRLDDADARLQRLNVALSREIPEAAAKLPGSSKGPPIQLRPNSHTTTTARAGEGRDESPQGSSPSLNNMPASAPASPRRGALPKWHEAPATPQRRPAAGASPRSAPASPRSPWAAALEADLKDQMHEMSSQCADISRSFNQMRGNLHTISDSTKEQMHARVGDGGACTEAVTAVGDELRASVRTLRTDVQGAAHGVAGLHEAIHATRSSLQRQLSKTKGTGVDLATRVEGSINKATQRLSRELKGSISSSVDRSFNRALSYNHDFTGQSSSPPRPIRVASVKVKNRMRSPSPAGRKITATKARSRTSSAHRYVSAGRSRPKSRAGSKRSSSKRSSKGSGSAARGRWVGADEGLIGVAGHTDVVGSREPSWVPVTGQVSSHDGVVGLDAPPLEPNNVMNLPCTASGERRARLNQLYSELHALESQNCD